ncbi:Acyl-ACP Thioesterase A [Klebsormidium nitens]|uniref:Acyl-[acyl-carrier-protein] hydrolase n=1 Tax=Klebsormidium nitens TaxID=105231 RepID=A0A1Y1HRZ6_KLENI|nr:Acyl-ACP Thioesterase A [Klebsormidium nitens]|eukprot:GAQ78608.1 Acyl-ACP Thioesterase A [Klebsormidium nitens]
MSTKDRTMKQKFMTRWYEVGANGKARMETIANYMQEIGANHVNTLYTSSDGLATSPLMKKHGLVWVITKMHIEMDSYPSWGDVVLVESWTEPVGKNGGRRDWTFSNSQTGEELGRATSLWVMMNLDTRRLARIPEDVRNEYASFCPEVPRFAIADQASISQRLPQGEGPPTRSAKDLQARFCDLDLHHHINNVTYTSWFLEAIDRNLWQTHDLYSITIEFRRECTGEDLVESMLHAKETGANQNGHAKLHEGELTFLHSLCLQESRKELARGQTRWRKRKEGTEIWTEREATSTEGN